MSICDGENNRVHMDQRCFSVPSPYLVSWNVAIVPLLLLVAVLLDLPEELYLILCYLVSQALFATFRHQCSIYSLEESIRSSLVSLLLTV